MNFAHPVPSYADQPITSGLRFGVTRTTTDPPHIHKGVDLAWGYTGTPVTAAAPGTVIVASTITGLGGPGLITIDHGDGWSTRYLHLAANPPVAVGDQVASGQTIGEIANLASGPHVHFEVLQNGVAIDPETILGAAVGGGLLLAAVIAGLAYWYWRKR